MPEIQAPMSKPGVRLIQQGFFLNMPAGLCPVCSSWHPTFCFVPNLYKRYKEMTSQIIPFNFNDSTLRVVKINNDPWFVAKDISDILDYSASEAMLRRLDDDEKLIRQIVASGQNRDMWVINESGLYASILGSKKPEAKRFRKWVTSEVLPTIRKTGGYQVKHHAKPSLSEIKAQLLFAKHIEESLRMSDTSKLRMYSALINANKLPVNMLPEYTDESLTRAMGDLLREHQSGLSAMKANQILFDLGILERLNRRSKSGDPKSFWSITDKGMLYGRNETAPQSPNETHPRWYVNKFSELLGMINSNVLEVA